MRILVNVVLIVVAAPAVLSALYLLVLTLLSARAPARAPSSRRQRFDIIVPAHDEAAVILRTIEGLKAIDWPADRFRIVVVADNCTDDTAAIAARAGAVVLERRNRALRGKGHALEFAFQGSRDAGFADAVVVVDADAVVSANLLEAISSRLDCGEQAVQVLYGILNPQDSWRTRLLTIATAAFHIVRSRARERLGLSCGIRGNGWCVTHELLSAVPYGAYSLAEDIEYGITLGLAGVRVAYVDEACSNAEMVTGERASRQQRQRWEHGRLQLVRTRTGRLLAAGIRRPSAVCLDLALDLIVLPLSYVILNILVLFGLALVARAWYPGAGAWPWVPAACVAALLVHVLRGWQLSGIGARGLLDLACAPFYLLWKVVLMLRPYGKEWVRTDRERP